MADFDLFSFRMQTKSQQILELKESNEGFENYFNNTIIPQIQIDTKLLLRKFNLPAKEQFELEGELIGLPIEKIKTKFRYPDIVRNIRQVAVSGKIMEREIQTSDRRWYQMNILPYLENIENKTNAVIVTFVDITFRINNQKKQESLIAEQQLLMDTIAHDIKNPLLGLGFTIQTLKKSIEKKIEKLPALIENIENSIHQINRMVNDLADLRWHESYSEEAEEELIDVYCLLGDIKSTLAHQIMESRAVIKEEIRIYEIKFIRRKLFSLIYNLVNNAVKYITTYRVPEILIKLYEENDQIIIVVADNGKGINRINQQRIFEKFQRAEESGQGSGVGLYLVNKIVTDAGGRIELDSEPERGSIFKIFLKKNNI